MLIGKLAGIFGTPAFALTIDKAVREPTDRFFLPLVLRPLLVEGALLFIVLFKIIYDWHH